MRKIREALRLTAAGLSARQIAGSVGIARSTVADCVRRAAAADLSWPLRLLPAPGLGLADRIQRGMDDRKNLSDFQTLNLSPE